MTVVNIGRKHTFRLYGILAGKAGGAETAFCIFGKLDNVFVGKVAQRIGADDLIDLPFLCGASSRIRTYDLLITRELHYHCAIEAFGSLMGIEPMTTRATTWHSTN